VPESHVGPHVIAAAKGVAGIRHPDQIGRPLFPRCDGIEFDSVTDITAPVIGVLESAAEGVAVQPVAGPLIKMVVGQVVRIDLGVILRLGGAAQQMEIADVLGIPQHSAPDISRPSLVFTHRTGSAVVVVGVEGERKPELFEITGARSGSRLFPRLVERGEQHRGENGDDGNHHQQFDQCKLEPSHFACSPGGYGFLEVDC